MRVAVHSGNQAPYGGSVYRPGLKGPPRHARSDLKNLKRLVAAAVLAIAAAPFTPYAAHAEDGAAELSLESLTEVELEPGESAVFRKGDTAMVELLDEAPVTEQSAASAELNTAPNCIVAKVEKGFIQVYNNCGGTEPQRIKVTLAFAPDTACKSIEPGTRANVGPARGRITGVYLC